MASPIFGMRGSEEEKRGNEMIIVGNKKGLRVEVRAGILVARIYAVFRLHGQRWMSCEWWSVVS
jgi:hypothetical protein